MAGGAQPDRTEALPAEGAQPDRGGGAQSDRRADEHRTRLSPGEHRSDILPDRRRFPLGWDAANDLDKDPGLVPDPAEVEVPEALRTAIAAAMARYPDRYSAALPALASAQKVHGWCSPLAIHQTAAVMQVTPAYLSSVATFYDMLRTEPGADRYVFVCTSVACHLRNAKAVYEAIAEEAREQGLEGVDLREFECLGACDMAPMASIDGRYVGPLDESDAHELIAAVKEKRQVLPGRGLEDSDFKLPWNQPTT